MPVPLVRLFSLDLLKAFVAVGRRMSMTAAADDLCLTQSAISRQILAFEDQLGAKLFVRRQRGVEFTAEGERLFRAADHAVQLLQDIAGEISPGEVGRAVTVTASIGVTGLWLLPRLGGLQQLYPKLDVRLSANNHLSDLRADGIDLAIRYCKDSSAPLGAVRLFGESVAPVGHHSLQAGPLSSQPLIEFDDPRPWLQWRNWLDAEGWTKAQQRGVLRFNQYDQVIQAALAGQGVALGRLELVHSLVGSQQLAVLQTPRPSERSPNSYWLIQADESPRADVARVADWIRSEAAHVSRSLSQAPWARPGGG